MIEALFDTLLKVLRQEIGNHHENIWIVFVTGEKKKVDRIFYGERDGIVYARKGEVGFVPYQSILEIYYTIRRRRRG